MSTAVVAEPAGVVDERSSSSGARSWTRVVLATVVVAAPLLVAVAVLAGRRWYPVLDLAMTELRVRDVGGRFTPLIGLPGRIGVFPDQGSHPGPLSFWLLAPTYRLFGSSAWAMEVATVVLALVWIGLAVWFGQRRLGMLGVVTVALVVAVLVRGYGVGVLVQPWNPYLPLLAWLVVLLALWSVFAGDTWMLVPLAVSASFAAQTHIPYLVLAGGLGVIGAAVVVVRAVRASERREFLWPLLATGVIFVVAWVGPMVDQLRRDPGNIRRLIDHFTSPSEATVGLVGGVELLLRHLDVVTAYGGLFTRTGSFLEASYRPDGAIWPGAILLTVWIASIVISVRLDRTAGGVSARTWLHVTLIATTVLSLFSMARIFGKVWYYLTLWAWGTTTLVLVAIAWTALSSVRSTRSAPATPPVIVTAAVLAVGFSVATSVAALDAEHPEERLGETFGVVVEPTAEALDAGVGAATGREGRYVVKWTDAATFGSQGYGLVNELERSGFDVGVYDTWRVPVTPHRVIPIEEATAEVILATGVNVERWRGDPRVVEVVAVDPRDPDELAEFAAVRAELIDRLEADGLDDLVDLVDTNLFGVLVDTKLSPAGQDLADRLLYLGQETAVFIAPPGTAP